MQFFKGLFLFLALGLTIKVPRAASISLTNCKCGDLKCLEENRKAYNTTTGICLVASAFAAAGLPPSLAKCVIGTGINMAALADALNGCYSAAKKKKPPQAISAQGRLLALLLQV